MCNVKGFVSDWRCLPSLFRFRGRAQVWAGRRWAVMFGMRALYCHQHYHHQHQHTAGTSEYKECYLDVESTGNLVLLKTIMSGAVVTTKPPLRCSGLVPGRDVRTYLSCRMKAVAVLWRAGRAIPHTIGHHLLPTTPTRPRRRC